MKKFLFGMLILIMFIPFVVKADMGAPMLRQYEVLVAKEDGIDYYDYYSGFKKKGTYNKDQVLTVIFESEEDGQKYLAVSTEGGYNYNDYYYVKASDVVVKNGEVKTSDSGVAHLEKANKFRIYKEDAIVRKGPSFMYDEVGKVKKGTIGSYKFYIEGSQYIYVDVDGVSGWIDTSDSNVLFYDGNYIASEKIELSCATIPVGTVLTNVWRADSWGMKSLITYDDCTELFDNFRTNKFVSLDETPKVNKISKDIKIYDTTSSNKKVLKEVTKGSEVVFFTEYGYIEDFEEHWDDVSYYVMYDGIKGWTSSLNYDDFTYVKDSEESLINPEEVEPPAEEPKEEEKDEKNDDKKSVLDTKTVILMCVVAGVSICLTAIVTIILVNKKNKKVEIPKGE